MTMQSKPMWMAAVAIVGGLLAGTATAEHRKTVNGLLINIGVVPAPTLSGNPGERAVHGGSLAGGTHHLVVSVADAATGRYLDDARVSVEVIDPRGSTQTKRLVPAAQHGFPDYSEVVRFGWSGKYRLRVKVEPAGGAGPTTAEFAWTQPAY